MYMVFAIADNDECTLNTHQCSQLCNNTIGSYVCNCYVGYLLMNDGLACNGISNVI